MGAGLELPPGFRFHPTDEELVMHYLVPRCASQSVAAPIIAEVDLYKYDPWDLPGKALCGEKEWYFFTPRERKYPNGSRPNRAAGSGYWKATGADKPIGQPKTLGIKKALVFYAGKAPKGDKTNWIMHEYRLADVDRSARRKNSLRLDDWVLCRIYNKKGKIERRQRPPQQEDRNQTTSFEDYPEDRKPKIPMPRASGIVPPAPPAVATSSYDHVHFDTSDSVPRLHTESSCSEHVVSPEFACEVQSSDASRWPVSGSDLGLDMEPPLDFSSEYVGATWGDFGGGASGSCGSQQLQGANQMSPLQDIFMYLQKPF